MHENINEIPEPEVVVCVCGSSIQHTRPSGDIICAACGRPVTRVAVKQPRP